MGSKLNINKERLLIRPCSLEDMLLAETICEQYKVAAREKGVGIAQREANYLNKKIEYGDAVIAFMDDMLAGFCYMETYDEEQFVVHSGLIVFPAFRNMGISSKIKTAIFKLSRKKYPNAKIFGLTTSIAVMKINLKLGYEPTPFSELTKSEAFWNGCKSCNNYDVLTRNRRRNCLCLGLMFLPINNHDIVKTTHKEPNCS